MAIRPPIQTHVKGYRYTVRPGDDVVKIAGAFGMPASAWPGLVGANLDVPLGDYGYRYPCFRSLDSGMLLRIPASWGDPQAVGVSAPPLDLLASWQQAINDLWKNSAPLGATPPVNLYAIAGVLFSWWSQLGELFKLMNFPGMPTPANLEAVLKNGILTPAQIFQLMQSAGAFLDALKVGLKREPNQGDLPNIIKTPWGDIPWDSIPWDQLPVAWAKISEGLAGKNAPPSPPYTTPTLPALPLPNLFDPATWLPGTTHGQAVRSQSFANTTWDGIQLDVLRHPDFAKCALANPLTLTPLQKCEACWQTADQFVKLLCKGGTDPCAGCKAQPPIPALPPTDFEKNCDSLLSQWSNKCGDLEVQTPECDALMKVWIKECAPPPGDIDPVDPGKKQPPGTEPVKAEGTSNAFKYAAVGVGVALLGGMLLMISDKKS